MEDTEAQVTKVQVPMEVAMELVMLLQLVLYPLKKRNRTVVWLSPVNLT